MTKDNADNGFQPEVTLAYCRRAFGAGQEPPQGRRAGGGFSVRLMMLPCSSKLQLPHLLRILEQGADALEVVACPEGACQFLQGNQRADKRIAYARNLLDQVGMGAERLGITRAAGLDLDGLLECAGRRAQLVRDLGPNAMKGDNS